MKFNFLIAGVQKAATTAVHSFLRSHPQIFMPVQKELHFFDSENGVDWSNPDYSVYRRHLRNTGAAKVFGEATPIYTFWPSSIERIHNYNKNMRLIVILRDPVERAYSQWKMQITRGEENQNFSLAIREGRQRVSGSNAMASGNYSAFSYVERGLYAAQVRRVLTRFPRHQILFVTMDMLSQDFCGLLDSLCGFLGVENFKTYPENRVLRAVKPRSNLGPMNSDDRSYLMSIFDTDIAETAQLTNLELSSWS